MLKRFDKINEQRVDLIIKKFESGLTKEEAIKLEKLDKQLVKMSPLVTEKEKEILYKINQELKEISKRNDKRAKRFGFLSLIL